jgi:hypothetical protein
MNHPLRCRCGTLHGHVVVSSGAIRAICYCKDCQAYARFLDTRGITDENGGTEIVATLPKQVHFSSGLEALACMSLSERGILRWYASCCRTPIGNTPREPKVSYAGIVRSCLESRSPTLESSFGPLRIAVNTKSARSSVRPSPIATIAGMGTLMKSLLGARLTGGYKDNPFFEPGTSTPVRPVHVLSPAERERVYRHHA